MKKKTDDISSGKCLLMISINLDCSSLIVSGKHFEATTWSNVPCGFKAWWKVFFLKYSGVLLEYLAICILHKFGFQRNIQLTSNTSNFISRVSSTLAFVYLAFVYLAFVHLAFVYLAFVHLAFVYLAFVYLAFMYLAFVYRPRGVDQFV